jgi:signal transduction histidine kinase
VIEVADTGTGIPAEIRANVFDPFFTTKPVGRGTGQGLAIVRSVVDRHNGQVEFETEMGVGTTFTIRLRQLGRPRRRALAGCEASRAPRRPLYR